MEEAELPIGTRADLGSLVVRPRPAGSEPAATAGRHDLLAVRGLAGEFLVPAGPGSRAAHTLRAYNRLRPPRVRAARSVLASAFDLGLGRVVASPRSITVPADHESLLDHLADVLHEPAVCFAGTARVRDGFVTPVLQLFSTEGTCVGFAKIGWDDVTREMVATEAEALDRAAVAGLRRVHVPAVLWHGRWHDLAVLVTAPMPASVRRLSARDRVHAPALSEIAAIDGPVRTLPLRRSPYWQDAARVAGEAAVAGCPATADRFEQLDREHGDVDLPFGRWHGDLVPWNLARAGHDLHAWDWAYSAPGVPVGFDALHFAYLPRVVLDRTPPDAASTLAAANVEPVLVALGLDDSQRRAVAALHRFEQDLREERARLQRAGRGLGTGLRSVSR